jgi:hypothetical protein
MDSSWIPPRKHTIHTVEAQPDTPLPVSATIIAQMIPMNPTPLTMSPRLVMIDMGFIYRDVIPSKAR